jgi:hypothetical protein
MQPLDGAALANRGGSILGRLDRCQLSRRAGSNPGEAERHPQTLEAP